MAANMVVRTNVFALNAHRNMKNVGAEQQRASNRLASGFRINSAADDAAGLAISETMRAQIRGLDQASRNAQDGQALINTAEGGMQEIQNMLQRVRELTVQAANDTNVQLNRDQISLEIAQLFEEIDEMANRTQFNGMNLLTGDFEAGEGTAGTPTLLADGDGWWRAGVGNPPAVYIGADTAANDATPLAVTTWQEALGAVLDNDIAGGTDQQKVDLLLTWGFIRRVEGATGTEQFQLWQNGGWNVNLAGADATEILANLEDEGSDVTHQAIMDRAQSEGGFREVADGDVLVAVGAQPGTGNLVFQIGANSEQIMRAEIADMRLAALIERNDLTQVWVDNLEDLGGKFGSNDGDGFTGDEITGFIDDVQKLLDDVSWQRAKLGAYSNRLDFTSRSLDITSENLSDAESRVRNTDMAREMMRFTMSNVLQQAAVSMLAQANQLPNNLLQLLR